MSEGIVMNYLIINCHFESFSWLSFILPPFIPFTGILYAMHNAVCVCVCVRFAEIINSMAGHISWADKCDHVRIALFNTGCLFNRDVLCDLFIYKTLQIGRPQCLESRLNFPNFVFLNPKIWNFARLIGLHFVLWWSLGHFSWFFYWKDFVSQFAFSCLDLHFPF